MEAPLGLNELERLTLDVLEYVREQIIINNQKGILNEYLSKINFLRNDNSKEITKEKRILVIGQSQAQKKDLEQVSIEKGIDPGNLDFVLNYKDVEKFDFHSIKQANKYDVILVGPMGHKQKGLTKYSSMIAELEATERIETIRIENSRGNLEINKTSFGNALLYIGL